MTSVAVFLLALGLFYVQAASIPGRERRSEDSDACKVDNWIQYKEAEYGLYKSNKKFTFDEGVDACGRCNWALPVTIHSASEMEFVKSLNSENKPFWLGYTSLYSDGSYWWMDGEESNYTDWKKGEPDNIASDSKIATSDVNCSYVTKEGQWRDHRCDQTKRVICKRMIDIFHPEIPVDMSNTTDDGSVSGNEGEEIPETCGVGMTTPAAYNYIPVRIPSTVNMTDFARFSFAVKICNDAHIALSADDVDLDNPMYEIVIGGWRDTSSVIRHKKQGSPLVSKSHTPVDCDQFKRFYVRWSKGLIEVGAQVEKKDPDGGPDSYVDQDPFMSFWEPYPPTIRRVYVSGWDVAGTWALYFPCEKQETSETCGVGMTTPARYDYFPVRLPPTFNMADADRISFAVKTCNDAHIALSDSHFTSDLDRGDNMYEIVIGGWRNSESVIRSAKQGTPLVNTFHTPVDCDQFKRFYVRWNDTLIEVGAQVEGPDGGPSSYDDLDPFMSYSNPSPPTIRHVFVSGWDVAGTWALYFPCKLA